MQGKCQPGAALQAALKARGCALGRDEARALAVLLRDLICDGLIGPEPLAAVQQVIGQRASEIGPQENLWSGATNTRTPAYNMGSVYCMDGEQ